MAKNHKWLSINNLTQKHAVFTTGISPDAWLMENFTTGKAANARLMLIFTTGVWVLSGVLFSFKF
ncbi:MAG TPA: hypothetical protein VGN20_06565 [Mucilaginibacter sp.]